MSMNRKSARHRAKLIDTIVKDSVTKYGTGVTSLLSSKGSTLGVEQTISTYSPELDRILAKDVSGNFGMPVGRIIGVSGLEASGKSTLAIMVMKSTQKMGGIARLIETEHAFDPLYAEILGLDLSELLMSQPDYLEQALDMIADDARMFREAKEEYIDETNEKWDVPMTIVLDSIAGIPPKAEFDAESFGDDQARALHARLLSKFFRKISGLIAKEQICLICTNQLKTDTEVRYGNKDAEIGGRALKFHASLKLDLRRSGFIKRRKSDTEPIGITTRIKTVKNKVMLPFKEVEIPIIFNEGISYERSFFNLLKTKKVIKQSGASYSLKYKNKKGEKFIIQSQGIENFLKKFRTILPSKNFQKYMNKKLLKLDET